MINHSSDRYRSISKKNGDGTAMVEFALVLPIFLLIVFGVVNYGILLFDQAVITNAAREGARWGAIHTTSTTKANCGPSAAAGASDPCGVANNYATSGLITFGDGNLQTSSTGDGTAHSLVTVEVEYDYWGVGYSLSTFNQRLKAKAVMYHE